MTFDSIFLQRFIIILLVLFIIFSIIKRMGKFACFCISILCLMQVGYYLGTTSLNDTIPFSDYFKYDVVKSITSIWNETDKEALKQDITNGINTGVEITEDTIDISQELTQELINKYKDYKEQENSTESTEKTENTESSISNEELIEQILLEYN